MIAKKERKQLEHSEIFESLVSRESGSVLSATLLYRFPSHGQLSQQQSLGQLHLSPGLVIFRLIGRHSRYSRIMASMFIIIIIIIIIIITIIMSKGNKVAI